MDTPIAQKDLIEGLGKGLRVIEAFDDDHPRLTPSEAAERTGLTRTAARRYLLSLVHFGYADSDGKQFWLLPRVLRLGQSYLGAARLPRLVQPFIQRLSMDCGETVNVSVLDGHEVVYIARSNSPRLVSIGFHAGARVPAHVVSPGVVLLTALPEHELRRWLEAHEFGSYTPQTLVAPEGFAEQVNAARQLGHWIAVGQLDAGLTGLATVLKDRRGELVGAISATVPSASWSASALEQRLMPQLLQTAKVLRDIL